MTAHVRMPMNAPVWTHSVGLLVLAELRQRYAGSVLGALWAVLAPLLEVAAYALVFGLLLGPAGSRDGLGFAFFVASGLLPWSSLREALEASASALHDNRWIRRSRVPPALLVSRAVLASATRAAAGIVLVLGFAASRGLVSSPASLTLPVVALGLQLAVCHGLGLALAPLGVLYPDLRPALGSGLTLLTFASPILYPESALPSWIRGWLEWNPFTHLLRLYRAPLGVPGTAGLDLAVVGLVSAVLLGVGHWLSQRLHWAARDRL